MRMALTRWRGDFIVLTLVAAGFLLNLYAPIWLAPPLFPYTVWLYLLLFFAWIPAYLLLLRGQRRSSLMILTILVGSVVLSCACMTIRPRSAFGVTVLDSVTCEEQMPAAGRSRYACTRHSFEGSQFDRTFVFDALPGLPIMWLVEGEF